MTSVPSQRGRSLEKMKKPDAGGRTSSRLPLVQIVQSNGLPILAGIFFISTLIRFRFFVGTVQLEAHRVFLLIFFIPLLIRFIQGKAGRLIAADVFVFLTAAWSALAYQINPPAIGEPLQYSAGYFLEMFGGYLVGRVCIVNEKNFLSFSRLWMITVFIMLPLAMYESFAQDAFLMKLTNHTLTFETRLGLKRAYVVFYHPIAFGTFAASSLGVAWYVCSLYQPTIVKIIKSAIIGVTSFFSLSSGALFALFVQLLFISYYNVTKKIPRPWLMLFLGFVGLWIAIEIFASSSPAQIFIRYASLNQSSAYNRVLIFEYGIKNIVDKPLFGFGGGSWDRLYFMPASIDNFWLIQAMQFGLPALFTFVMATYFLVKNAAVARLDNDLANACRSGYLISMAAFIVTGLTVHYWQAMMAFVMFLFGAGAWIQTRSNPDASEVTPDKPRQQPAEGDQRPKAKYIPYGRPRDSNTSDRT